MAWRKSYRRYRRWRRWRKYGYRRRYRRGRVINATSRSRVRMRITTSVQKNMVVPVGATGSYVMAINPWMYNKDNTSSESDRIRVALPCSMVNTELYDKFAALYDEVKVDAMTVNITLLNPLQVNVGPNALTFHTAWDRNGNRRELEWTSDDLPEQDIGIAGSYPLFSDLASLSSHSSAIATQNSIPKIVRTVYASDLMEKISFADSDCIQSKDDDPDVRIANSMHRVKINSAFYDARGNFTPFSPTFFFALEQPTAPLVASSYAVQVQCTFTVTFRNPKFGASTGDGGGNRSRRLQPVYPGLPNERVPVALAVARGEAEGEGPGMDPMLDGVDAATAVGTALGLLAEATDDAGAVEMDPDEIARAAAAIANRVHVDRDHTAVTALPRGVIHHLREIVRPLPPHRIPDPKE